MPEVNTNYRLISPDEREPSQVKQETCITGPKTLKLHNKNVNGELKYLRNVNISKEQGTLKCFLTKQTNKQKKRDNKTSLMWRTEDDTK